MSSGIVIRQPSAWADGKAQKLGLAVEISTGYLLPWEKTLFVGNPEATPWDLVPAGFAFLDQWDAAVPTWRQASELGTPEERARTEQVGLDLRQPTYEPRLLFVRDNPAGRDLLGAWRAECGTDGDEHLAFLRAVHLIKPRLCVLPMTWLSKMPQPPVSPGRFQPAATHGTVTRSGPKRGPLIRFEIEPGRFVKIHKGDEEKVLTQFKAQKNRRR